MENENQIEPVVEPVVAEPTVAEPTANIVQRDQAGRFAGGTPAGPGAPKGKRRLNEQNLRAMILASQSPGNVKEIMNALFEKARAGSVTAITLYLRYMIGDQPLVSISVGTDKLQMIHISPSLYAEL